MSAARKPPPDPRRQQLMAKVHIAKKQLGLDDDTYRAVLARHGRGKTSAAELTAGELIAMVEELKAKGWAEKRRAPKRAGRLRPTVHSVQAMVRALWIDAYHLGVVQDASEGALAAFVRRQAKVEALQWLRAYQAPSVIEALKAMMTRSAGVSWEPYRFFDLPAQHRPKARVLEAQWRILCEAGVMHRTGNEGLCAWLELVAGVRIHRKAGELGHVFLEEGRAAELDRAIALLGNHVREARGK